MVKNGKNCVHVVFQCPLAWSFICMAFVEFAPTGVINFFMGKTNEKNSSSNSIVYTYSILRLNLHYFFMWRQSGSKWTQPQSLRLLPNFLLARKSHYHFTRLNPKKKGTLQFCLPALQGIHRHPMQKEFFRSTEGFLRAALTGHGHPGPL